MMRIAVAVLLLPLVCLVARGESPPEVLDPTLAPLRALIERYRADLGNLQRFYDAPRSDEALQRRTRFFTAWQDRLRQLPFDDLGREDQVDYLLLANRLEFELQSVAYERERYAEMQRLVHFAYAIVELHESQRTGACLEPRGVAETLTALDASVADLRTEVQAALDEAGADRPAWLRPLVANRAARHVDALQRTLKDWYGFYAAYDPLFTWWVRRPHEALQKSLGDYAGFLREKVVGIDPDEEDPILGDPVGAEMLARMLRYEMIPYTPEELIAIAEREFAWCRAEMLRASRDLGFGENWRDALNHVKNLHVGPGEQPELIRELADEAVAFLTERDLLTIPPLAVETWRMEMMSPARQKVSPYFLGGETIIVSFPTDGMEHADKLMSLRGNNRHFSRATVHHELIPGHHLQGFMNARYRRHRRVFRTPFWGEGWALYWEMRLWDLEFPRSAEDRVGMLFWRTHRCARIIFSLKFHLGEMTADEAIDFLVENVGHERNNATAEVRRSVSGDYPPLYQAAYMLGGLQIRSLHKELVQSGRMSERAFHDAILQQNSIPIELVRAILTDQPLTRAFETSWRFYE